MPAHRSRQDTDCDRCSAIRAPENGRVAVLGWCHATVFEASERMHLSPAIDVQPRQGLTLGCHDMHGHWLLEPQFHLDVIMGDEFEVFTYLMPVKLPMDLKVYSRSWNTWAPLVTVSKTARPDEVSMVTLSALVGKFPSSEPSVQML